MRRRPPRSTQSRSSAASDVYKRQGPDEEDRGPGGGEAQRLAEECARRRKLRRHVCVTGRGRDARRGRGLKAHALAAARARGRLAPRDEVYLGAAVRTLSLIHISEPTRL